GALQLAFEQLKKKLDAEGLFDPARKVGFPLCPRNIGIVTSPTGAAVRDILKVFQRSPYPLCVTVFPVRVQGAEAAEEIAAAVASADALAGDFDWDLLIVGRGGGSMEDLWPFNEEIVARAMATCAIPIISAVGHEIDFTISDLVADLRMPTPTAAAEWVVARLDGVARDLTGSRNRLFQMFAQRIDGERQRLHYLRKRLAHPGRKLEDMRLSLDERLERLQLAFLRRIERLRTARTHLVDRLHVASPSRVIQRDRTFLVRDIRELVARCQGLLERSHLQFRGLAARLGSLNPLSVLDRGYSIAYRLPDRKILRDSEDVVPGQDMLVQLSKGKLTCTVRKSE
ncbi:MAG: exodeoxyribonuclease VII large subunit, partial [Syntrophobacteraceae bacterium]|nr:exodeoxyribonuclease VII large subunit [Syntrophobacteraceae bacterium]